MQTVIGLVRMKWPLTRPPFFSVTATNVPEASAAKTGTVESLMNLYLPPERLKGAR